MQRMRYSFLLVNYNMGPLTVQCVDGIVANVGSEDYEVIIVDNSTDPAFRLSGDAFAANDRVRVEFLDENLGLVSALNRMLPVARGECVFVMHPDIVFQPGCLERIAEFFRSTPRAGVAAPNIFCGDGSYHNCSVTLPSVRGELRRVSSKLRHHMGKLFGSGGAGAPGPLWDRRSDAQVETVLSFCLILRQEFLREMGAIDARLWMYWVNDFICARARQLGWTCHYIRDARVIHYDRFTPPHLYSNRKEMGYKASMQLAVVKMQMDYCTFLKTFYSPLQQAILRALSVLQYLLEMPGQLRASNRRSINMATLWALIRVSIFRWGKLKRNGER